MRILLNTTSLHSKNIVFKSNPIKLAKIGFSNIEKITSEKKYDNLMNGLKKSKNWSYYWNSQNKFEEGIMPYTYREDISYQINSFLRDPNFCTKFRKINENFLTNIIKILDFALYKIDEIYGKFEGIVYRYGKTDNISEGFTSTAKNPIGAIDFYERYVYQDKQPEYPMYIIYTKNGHKINDVHKRIGGINPMPERQVCIDESEILLHPTVFEEITNPTKEMLDAKEALLKAGKSKNEFGMTYHYNGGEIIFLKEKEI